MSTITYIRIDFNTATDFIKIPSSNSSVFNHKMAYYQHYFYVNFLPNSPLKKYVCGIDASPPNYTIKKRIVSDAFLIFVIDGCGTINGIKFNAGQYFFIPANYKTTIVSDPDNPYTLCWLAWSGNISPNFTKIISSLSSNNFYVLPNSQQFKRLFTGFLRFDHSNSDILFMIESFANLIASLIANNRRICTESNQSLLTKKRIDYVEYAKEVISQEYANIDVNQLAKKLHLNRKYFCQLFHEIEGRSPQQFLIDTRLQASVHYIEDTKMTLQSIALTVGYTTYNGFVAAFKSKYNVTPNVYRKNYITGEISQ